MPPWCRSEKSLAWLGLTFIILKSALSLGYEHSIAKGFPTAAENSWSGARLPSEPFNLLKQLLSPCCEASDAARGNPNIFGGIAWRRRDRATS